MRRTTLPAAFALGINLWTGPPTVLAAQAVTPSPFRDSGGCGVPMPRGWPAGHTASPTCHSAALNALLRSVTGLEPRALPSSKGRPSRASYVIVGAVGGGVLAGGAATYYVRRHCDDCMFGLALPFIGAVSAGGAILGGGAGAVLHAMRYPRRSDQDAASDSAQQSP